jgi:hypothetical protein
VTGSGPGMGHSLKKDAKANKNLYLSINISLGMLKTLMSFIQKCRRTINKMLR